MLGLSRLGYSLALNRQIPSLVGRLHPTLQHAVRADRARRRCSRARLVLPADLEFLAAIYAFGATLAFLLVHLSVMRLRVREPDRDRPYKMPFNVRVGSASSAAHRAARGAVMSAVAFASVLVLHDAARSSGLGWMVSGVALYVAYRLVEGKPVFKRVTVPARALTRQRDRGGVRLDPRAGPGHAARRRHHADRRAPRGRGERGPRRARGAVIEALWVFEVPMALPLDARVADADLRRARKALARAKAVGEEYEGVEVATATVRARRAGEAIVHEARAARRGGDRAGRGGADGDPRAACGWAASRACTTRSWARRPATCCSKAPCRVILTAPPSADQVDPTLVDGDTGADQPLGHPLAHDGGAGSRSLESPTDVRARRRSRPGRLVRRHVRAARGPHASPCSTRTRCRTSASTSSSAARGRRPAGASRSAPRSSWTR